MFFDMYSITPSIWLPLTQDYTLHVNISLRLPVYHKDGNHCTLLSNEIKSVRNLHSTRFELIIHSPYDHPVRSMIAWLHLTKLFFAVGKRGQDYDKKMNKCTTFIPYWAYIYFVNNLLSMYTNNIGYLEW